MNELTRNVALCVQFLTCFLFSNTLLPVGFVIKTCLLILSRRYQRTAVADTQGESAELITCVGLIVPLITAPGSSCLWFQERMRNTTPIRVNGPTFRTVHVALLTVTAAGHNGRGTVFLQSLRLSVSCKNQQQIVLNI
jgi:hypothetical protein